jgi:hypothetical protein
VGYPAGEVAFDDRKEGFLERHFKRAFHDEGERCGQFFMGFEEPFP